MSSPRLSCEPPLLSDLLSRMPDWDRTFLLIVILVSGAVTVPQAVNFGETSGLGVWTTAIGAGVWGLWLVRPYYPRELSRILFPLLLFSVYATLSLSWGGVSVKALQNLSVSVGFTGFLLLSARECERQPRFAFTLHRAMDAASLVAAIAYTITVALYGQGADAFFGERPLFMARPFALFSAVAVARQLARWQSGDRKGFWVGAWLVTLVFLSQSRLCMVACLALFPLAMCCRGDARSIVRATMMAGVAAAVLVGTIFFSQSMYERFFGYDANINVGGVAINSSGRAEMWQALVDDLTGSSVYFGHGAGGAGRLIDRYFPGLGHPHNDFLRFLYDFGVVGLGLWVLFLLVVTAALVGGVRRCTRVKSKASPDERAGSASGFRSGSLRSSSRTRLQDHPDLPLHLAPLLALLAIVASMFTDNSVSYVFVMAPLATLIGASLSRLRLRTSVLAPAPVPAAAPVPAPFLPLRGRRVLYLPNWESEAPPAPQLFLPNWESEEPPSPDLYLPSWEAEEPPLPHLALPSWEVKRLPAPRPGERLALPNSAPGNTHC